MLTVPPPPTVENELDDLQNWACDKSMVVSNWECLQIHGIDLSLVLGQDEERDVLFVH